MNTTVFFPYILFLFSFYYMVTSNEQIHSVIYAGNFDVEPLETDQDHMIVWHLDLDPTFHPGLVRIFCVVPGCLDISCNGNNDKIT